MRPGRLVVMAAMAITCVLVVPLAQAAPPRLGRFPHLPLLMGVRQGQRVTGNIWAWDNSPLIPRTGGGLSYVPVVSPMGDSYVYLRIPAAYDKQTSPDQERP